MKWQMTLLIKKINLNMTNNMVMLTILHKIKNFKPYNNNLVFFTKYYEFLTTMILIVDFKSQLNSIS